MTELTEKKLNELDRSIFTLKTITTISRFFVSLEKYEEITERWSYVKNMYESLDNYNTLYQTTQNIEYKNYLENNYSSCIEALEEQKRELYSIFSLNSLLFLENIKQHFRIGFFEELTKITNQFNNAKDVSGYIYYHGSLDLNMMIEYALSKDINKNYKALFEQVKEKRIITYKKEEWLTIGTRIYSCFQEIYTKEKDDEKLVKYIYKLTAYRFLLTIFEYDV